MSTLAPPRKAKAPSKADTAAAKILGPLEAMLERGDLPPWAKPWHVSGAAEHVGAGGRPYHGANVLVLEVSSVVNGFTSRQWMTFRAIQKAGGRVNKGEKGTPVVLYRPVTFEHDNPDTGEREQGGYMLLRHYTVFSTDQAEGIDPAALVARPEPAEPAAPFVPIEAAESIVSGFHRRPKILHGGARACYVPSVDTVRMPDRDCFTIPAHYYSTLFHELGHSTGHGDRLARKGITDSTFFGSHAYGLEELVAETSAAILCAASGIDAPVIESTAAYCASWLARIREDRQAFLRMAGHGVKAARYILGEED